MNDFSIVQMLLYDENMNNQDAQNKFVKSESENFFAYLGIEEKSEKINKEQFLKTYDKFAILSLEYNHFLYIYLELGKCLDLFEYHSNEFNFFVLYFKIKILLLFFERKKKSSVQR